MVFEPPGHKATGKEGIHRKVMNDVTEVKGEINTLMSDNGQFPSLYPHTEKQPRSKLNVLHAY